MDNFDLRKFLIENKLTTSSRQLDELDIRKGIRNVAAGAAMTLGTLGAHGQQAPKQSDKVNTPITWQQMTQAQKAAKKAELVKQGGFEKFKQYKDSISANATSKLDADFEKNAAKRGMTVDQYRSYLAQNAKKADCGLDGMQGPNFNSGKSCGIAKAGDRENKKDWSKK